MNDNTPRGTLRIYGCGGGGTNITSCFEKVETIQGQAEILTTYVDTSTSNLKAGIDMKNVYLIKGDDETDGSGKIRSANVGIIKPQIKQIMYSHPPGFMNVVLYTGDGGTGSTAGVLLHKELLEQGERVISIVVGGETDAQAVANVVATLQDLDKVATLTEKPVIAVYDHNEPGESFKVVDEFVIQNILSLATLCSRQNEGLDKADLDNFFDFTKVSTHEASLTRIHVATDISKVSDNSISIASLFRSIDAARTLPFKLDYSTAGYCRTNALGDTRPDELHFYLTNGMNEVFQRLSKVNEDLKAKADARVKTKRISEMSGSTGIL